MNHNVPRAFVFDLGKVLIDFDLERACRQIAVVANIESMAVKKFMFDDGLQGQFEAGTINFETLHEQFSNYFNVKIKKEVLAFAASDIFTPIESSIQLLTELNQKYRPQIQFVLLSNTNELHWSHIENQWLVSRWFDHLILSYEVKAMKPDSVIFNEVTRMTGHQPEHCFFVDDMPQNVDGARRAGLDAEVFAGTEKLREDLRRRGIDC